jgi:hypothetical protein
MGARVIDAPLSWTAALSSLLLALGLGMLIAWTYSATYQGLSYLREFQHTLALAGVVAAVILLAIGNEIARGIGMVGALTLIRFRSTLKDTRDLIFAFASLGVGVACGGRSHRVAILGTVVFIVAVSYISWSSFGSRKPFDAVLRLRVPGDPGSQRRLVETLQATCSGITLVQLAAADGAQQDHVYHLRLVDPDRKGDLLRDVAVVPGVEGATLFSYPSSSEI